MTFRSFPEITLKKRKNRSYYAKRVELGLIFLRRGKTWKAYEELLAKTN